MGTSNWQNLPFCIESLMKIAPDRVLDVGVGFGRWGMIVREFCDVWQGRISFKDWQVHLEGVEGFADNITDYHNQFYNKIHIQDARQILPHLFQLDWDVIIFGDVLEHFKKTEGQQLLEASLTASSYVLVNIPLGPEWPQDDAYDNPYERHLSVWHVHDFESFHLKRADLFEDFLGRPFGSFVLSRSDPKGLTHSLFSKNTNLVQLEQGTGPRYLTPVQQKILLEAEQNAAELTRIKNTLTWRTYEWIDQSLLGKPLRQFMKVVGAPIRHKLAKNNNDEGHLSPVQVHQVGHVNNGTSDQSGKYVKSTIFSGEEEEWLSEACKDKPEAIAILHPDWKGIRSATGNLFSNLLFVEDNLTEVKAIHLAHLLAETACDRIILSGFPLTYHHLVKALHEVSPQTKIFVLWHGNFLHTHENYAWQGFRLIQQLCNDQLIYKWGFVKKGMAEIVAAQTGIQTHFVMNYVRPIPEKPSTPLSDGPHIGLFSIGSIWKPPYAMLAATALIPDAQLHLAGLNSRVIEFVESLGIKNVEFMTEAIPQEKMPEILAQMHLNMNISLAECTPMLPLESLSIGAPCLISATSHLFEDHPYLRERLIVPYHERPEIIAEYARQAVAERTEIITAYRQYALEYNVRAQASVAEFLEL